MIAWFDDPAKRSALIAEAQEWIGTPFAAHGRKRGKRGGVSCESLVLQIYVAVGFLPQGWAYPEVSVDWHRAHKDRSVMEEFLDARPEFLRQEPSPSLGGIRPGDLLGFRVGKTLHHLGLALGEAVFIHCLRPRGVHLGSLYDATYLGRLRAVWRPVIHGQASTDLNREL